MTTEPPAWAIEQAKLALRTAPPIYVERCARALADTRRAALEDFNAILQRYLENGDAGCPEMIADLHALIDQPPAK